MNEAQKLFAHITSIEVGKLPKKDGSRPTKHRNGKQKRKLLASTYHQNPARTYAEALAEDVKRVNGSQA